MCVHAYVCDGVHCRRRLNDTDTVSHHARLICFSVCVFVSKYANVYPMFQVYKAKVCACARCALLCVCVCVSVCVCLPSLTVHDCLLSDFVCFIYFPSSLFTSQSDIHPAHVCTDLNTNVICVCVCVWSSVTMSVCLRSAAVCIRVYECARCGSECGWLLPILFCVWECLRVCECVSAAAHCVP